MFKDDYRHFVVIVAGDKPEKILEKYDSNKIVDPYVVYKFSDAGILKARYLEVIDEALKNKDLSQGEKNNLKEAYIDAKVASDEDFFFSYTEDFEHDALTGDAISNKNPNGKWTSCRVGKLFSVPFLTTGGIETFVAKKGEVDWNRIHLYGQEIYGSAWDMVMEGKTPESEVEQKIYDNMRNRTTYFSKFGSRENYVASSTAFWGYAFADENAWTEIEDGKDQFEWMTGFYDRFIVPLPDETTLTIYECTR